MLPGVNSIPQDRDSKADMVQPLVLSPFPGKSGRVRGVDTVRLLLPRLLPACAGCAEPGASELSFAANSAHRPLPTAQAGPRGEGILERVGLVRTGRILRSEGTPRAGFSGTCVLAPTGPHWVQGESTVTRRTSWTSRAPPAGASGHRFTVPRQGKPCGLDPAMAGDIAPTGPHWVQGVVSMPGVARHPRHPQGGCLARDFPGVATN